MSTTTQDMLDKALRPIKAFRTKAMKTGGLYSTSRPMPYFPITRSERAALRVQAEVAAESARADSVKRLADKLAPALDLWARRIRLGVGTDVPGSRTMDIARELAEIVEAGY